MTRIAIWKKNRALLKRALDGLKIFLKARRKILTVVSAIVVLGSFMVKEVWDEHLRVAEDRIKTSHESVERYKTTEVLILKIYSLQTSLDDIKDATKKEESEKVDSLDQKYTNKTEAFEEEIAGPLDGVDLLLPALRNRGSLEKKRRSQKTCRGIP